MAAGESPESLSIKTAVGFVLSKQNKDGGWGESYVACVNKAYPEDCYTAPGEKVDSSEGVDKYSGVVQTAWAVLTLLAAECDEPVTIAAVERGVRFLMARQLPSGDWAQEAITGVFNRSCGITYTAYRNIFPIWALGRYANRFNK
jgi:squalene cyclase